MIQSPQIPTSGLRIPQPQCPGGGHEEQPGQRAQGPGGRVPRAGPRQQREESLPEGGGDD